MLPQGLTGLIGVDIKIGHQGIFFAPVHRKKQCCWDFRETVFTDNLSWIPLSHCLRPYGNSRTILQCRNFGYRRREADHASRAHEYHRDIDGIDHAGLQVKRVGQ